MADTKITESKLYPIRPDEGFRDVFADSAGITRFNANGLNYVNIMFISQKIHPFADDSGRAVMANIVPEKVASITMSLERALSLRDALNQNLESVKVADLTVNPREKS